MTPRRRPAARAGAQPWRNIAWLGALVIAAIVGLAIFDTVRGYDATIGATGRDLDGQALVIAEQTARSIQAVDVVLRHLADLHRSGALQSLGSEELHAMLSEQAVGLVQADGLSLHDGDGNTLALSWRYPTPPQLANVSDRPAFQVVRETTLAGAFVGEALRSRDGRTDFFPIARRLTTATGEFAGVVTARGRIDYFQHFYRDAQRDPATAIALLHRGGTLLARYPEAPAALGQRFPVITEMLAAAAAGRSPTRAVSPVDGVDRFGAVAAVPDYPLVVTVTRDAAAALGPWRAQTMRSGLRTLALACLALALLSVVLRSLRRLDAARASLEVSQERFALAAAGSDDGVWDWDLVAGTAFESARARELQGLPPGPETQPLAELQASLAVHPDDIALRRDTLQAHLDGRTPAYEVDYRVRHGDGSYRWIRVRALCIRDASGTPCRIAGSVSDIDARKRAEEALRLSEERYAIAMTGSHEGHWVWDIRTDQVYLSERLADLFDLPLDQRMTTLAEFFSRVPICRDDYARVEQAVRDHIAGVTPRLEVEYRIVRRGETRWLLNRATCFRDAAGRAERMAGATVDVTERRQAEAALRRSEERYQLAVDGSNEGLWDWDLASDMLFLSPRAQEILWLTSDEPLQPRRVWIERTHYHPDDVGPVRRAIAEHLRGVTPHFAVEYRLRHHSGEWHWYRQRGVALRDADGKPYRMAGSMENISARKNAEAERDRLEVQLRQAQKLEAIGTLAGGIAHDFNNILSAILGYGELAQKDALEGTPLRRHVDAALAAGLRAKSLVERILAFSRSGMGERVPVHVQSVVTEALDGVAAALPASVALVRRVDSGTAGVLGDPTQIHQVVMNLCANAVQAMRAAGTLEVAADVCTLDATLPVATSTLAPGRYVRLAVRDTGTGIEAQVLERIFDPFFTTKEVGVGTGLGLSLVHGIVTDLGGGIAVESRVGEGSTFTVYLPGQSYVAAPAAAEERIAGGAGETILLVDDEEALVRLGEETLAELGYEPVGFASSSAALATFRADPERFHAVISDEAMPGMTGSELVREIRRIRPDVPIVLMSGYVSAGLAARARAAGVAEVLAKPLVARDIARSLASALRRAPGLRGDGP